MRLNAQRRWSEEEVASLATYEQSSDVERLCSELGRTERAVVGKLWNLGLLKSREWTDEQLAILTDAYQPGAVVDAGRIAAATGKTIDAVYMKASRLGLGDRTRKTVAQRKDRRRFETAEERSAYMSALRKRLIAEKGHPRGALGMKHSEETKSLLSAKSKARWDDPMSIHNQPEHRQKLSDNMLKNIAGGKMRAGYSRSRGGSREDLGGQYFRSSWEANYARYLNWLKEKGEIVGWEYEPKTFIFEKIKRGTRAYTPDFRVTFESHYEWHEVKGWMDDKSRTRLDRMARYFPGEKVILVDSKWFKSANKTLRSLIQNWEGGTVHV